MSGETKKKTILIVHSENTEKEANLLNQLIGSDESLNVKSVIYSSKQFKDNKMQIASDNPVIFIGYDDIVKINTHNIPNKFEKYGMQYGWLGNQAHLWLDGVSQLNPTTSSDFDAFFRKQAHKLDNGVTAPSILEDIMSYFTAVIALPYNVVKMKERRYKCLMITFFLDGIRDFLSNS